MPQRQKVEKAKDVKGTTKKLIRDYLSKYKIRLILVFIFAVASTIFTIVGPKILGNATTEIFNGIVSKYSGGAGINFENVANTLIMLVSFYSISAILGIVQGFIMTNVAQNISYKMRNDLIKKVNKLPMKYFDTKKNGEVLSIITNDIDTLQMNLNQSIHLKNLRN